MTKSKKDTTAAKTTDKPRTSLKVFMEGVNKKDKLNGLKITFGFTKRKRMR